MCSTSYKPTQNHRWGIRLTKPRHSINLQIEVEKLSALAGNRTRASRVAGENPTTGPPMLEVRLFLTPENWPSASMHNRWPTPVKGATIGFAPVAPLSESLVTQSGWPSGLRRCVQVAVSPGGVGSNPTSDMRGFDHSWIRSSQTARQVTEMSDKHPPMNPQALSQNATTEMSDKHPPMNPQTHSHRMQPLDMLLSEQVRGSQTFLARDPISMSQKSRDPRHSNSDTPSIM